MIDPTYIKEKIDRNPVWKLAFQLSEIDNDNAPIRWSRYIPMAQYVIENYASKEKVEELESAVVLISRELKSLKRLSSLHEEES